jgi:hypothetical protein
MFRKLDLFQSSGEEMATPTVLGSSLEPLEVCRFKIAFFSVKNVSQSEPLFAVRINPKAK